MVRFFYSESSRLYNVHVQSGRTNDDLCIDGRCADPENFLRAGGGGGGEGVQIPRRGLTENCNMANFFLSTQDFLSLILRY